MSAFVRAMPYAGCSRGGRDMHRGTISRWRRSQLRGCNFGVIQGRMASFSGFRVEMAGKAGALARLTAGPHQLNLTPSFGLEEFFQKLFEFSLREPQPRPKIAPQRIFYLPPALDFIRWEVAAADGLQPRLAGRGPLRQGAVWAEWYGWITASFSLNGFYLRILTQ
jgi:hypothetical protein